MSPNLFSTGIYLLAKFEAVSDRKLYRANNYVISGHSLEHLCLALIPFLLSVMLIYRERKFKRYFDGLFRFLWNLVLINFYCYSVSTFFSGANSQVGFPNTNIISCWLGDRLGDVKDQLWRVGEKSWNFQRWWNYIT